LFGICLGLETLHNLAADECALERYDAIYYRNRIYFTEAAETSRMLGEIDLVEMQAEMNTWHSHTWGVGVKMY
jgi:hypothetical protein